MNRWLLLLPLFLLACSIATPLPTQEPAKFERASIAAPAPIIVHKLIDRTPDGKAQVIYTDVEK